MLRWIGVFMGFALVVGTLGLAVGLSRLKGNTSAVGESVPAVETTQTRGSTPTKDVPALRPEIFVPEPEHDFGSVDLSEEAVHRFKIENRGTAPLKLQLGESTCRCTTGDVPAEPIPPGGEAEVTVRFLEDRHFGPFRQHAEILTNDPDRRRVTLTISGIVKSRLAVDPKQLDFSGMTPGLPARRSMTVFSQMWPEFWLEIESVTPEGVSCNVTPLSADAVRHLDARSAYRVDVEVPTALTSEKLEGEVRLAVHTTADAETRSLVIPFAGAPPANITIDSPFLGGGRHLNFGRIPQGKRAAAVLSVRTRDLSRPLAIKEAVCDPPHLRAALKPDPAVQGNYRLSIEIPSDCPRFVRLRGRPATVRVTFDDPGATSFEFQIWAAVVDPEISLPR